MPTGYTAKVCDGTITEFPEFAMQCARAFGALITMRDDPSDAPIPDAIPASTWNADRYAEDKTRLAQLQAMTPEQAEIAALKDYESRVAEVARSNARYDAENERLDSMLAKVRAWTPPTADHQEMKDFMIQQLTVSKSDWRSPLPVRKHGPEWLVEKIAEATRSLDYHAKEQAAENERARKRTEWLRSLRGSLHP